MINNIKRAIPDPVLDQYSSLQLLRDRNILLLSLANLLDQMSISLIVPLLPTYASDLGASALLIGLIFSAETAAKAVFSTPFGYLSDRFNRKLLIGGGLAISALSVTAIGVFNSPILFIVLRAVDGAATAMRSPATTGYLGDKFDSNQRASAMGAYRTLGMLGVAIGPALGGVLASKAGFALPFIVLGILTLVGSGIVLFLLDSVDKSSSSSDENDSQTWLQSMRVIFDSATVPMVAVAVSVFVAQMGTGAFNSMFAVLVNQNISVDPAYIGLMWSVFGGSMFIFMPLGGTLADQFGRRNSLVAGKLLWAVVVIGLVFISSRYLPPIPMFLAGLASALAGPALGALQYEVAPEGYQGTLIGFYSTLAAAGMSIGPILGGVIVDASSVSTLFIVMGGLWLVDTGVIAVGVSEE